MRTIQQAFVSAKFLEFLWAFRRYVHWLSGGFKWDYSCPLLLSIYLPVPLRFRGHRFLMGGEGFDKWIPFYKPIIIYS